jgi:tetratricopeptide (TPR) repeat protein
MSLTAIDQLSRRLDRLAIEHRRREATQNREDLVSAARATAAQARRLRIPELAAVALLRAGEVALFLGHPVDAVEDLRSALAELGEFRKHDLRVVIAGNLAEAYGRLGRWAEASEVCDRGIGLVERYRDRVSGPYMQAAYLRSRIGLYAWGARAALELDDKPLALARAELSKCRSVIRTAGQGGSRVETVELEHAFTEVCRLIDHPDQRAAGQRLDLLLRRRRFLWDQLSVRRPSSPGALPAFDLAAVMAELDTDQAILYYFWLEKTRLLIAVIAKHGVSTTLQDITPGDRAHLVSFAEHVLGGQHARGSGQAENPSINLGPLDKVEAFSPVLLPTRVVHALAHARRLLISPHRVLHAVPFQALELDGTPLIERFAIAYVPNLTGLLLDRPGAPQPFVIGMGIRRCQGPGRPLRPLERAEREVSELAHTYARNGVPVATLLGREATEERLAELTDNQAHVSCLHIATHGANIQTDTPLESHLFLHSSKLDGLKISSWKLRADLVVLSACSSGQRALWARGLRQDSSHAEAEELPGDDLFGLQAAFFATGTRQVLGSLWPTEDPVAAPIMLAFHERLVAGDPPDIALQSALVRYRHQARLLKRKVYYWAPFFLTVTGRAALRQAAAKKP